MSWQNTHARLRESLRQELRKQWGSIAEIEERVSCSNGYLNKLSAGTHEFKLDLFLKTLDALEVDPRTFFSRALGIQPVAEDYLRELEDDTELDPALARIEQATRQLETAEPNAPDPAATAGAPQASELIKCSLREQTRRLSKTRRYRTLEFTRAYLEQLDSLRYKNAVQAAKLAEKVAIHLIPTLPGPQADRLGLQCLALGIFGSSRRMKGKFSAAARTFRSALKFSRQQRLRASTAALLRRASYVLKDFDYFDRALTYLREALEIYVDLDSQSGIALTLVDRGMMLFYLGDYETTACVLEQALRRLDSTQTRHLFTAYRYLAYAYEELDELEAAESWLRQAVTVAGLDHGLYSGKLRWLQGTLALKRGAYRQAEELLRSASQMLSEQEDAAQEAMVSMDLVEALLAQERSDEACELATSMARLLEGLHRNRLAKMAVLQLVRAGLDGTLTTELLAAVRAQQEGRTQQGKCAPQETGKQVSLSETRGITIQASRQEDASIMAGPSVRESILPLELLPSCQISPDASASTPPE